jgi:heat shock protein HslJ
MSRHPSPPLRRSRSVVVALFVAILVASVLPGLAVAQDDSDPRNLEREWQLLEYRDPSGELQLVPPGIGVTALPFRGKIKGQAACSDFEATYTLAEDTFLVDAPAIQTRGCDEASQTIDEAFYQGLADTRKWSTRSSILTLRDEVDDVVMTLTRAKLPADPTIARWDLARLGAADGSIAPIIQGAEPWVEFLRGGRIVGSTGCGSFVGSYSTNDSTMAIRDVDARLTGCTDAVQQQADQILTTLSEITDFEVLPAGLVLEDSAGTTRMALVPAIDLGRRTWTPVEILDPDGTVVLGTDRLNTSAVRFAGGIADGRSLCRRFEGGSLRSGLALSAFDLTAGTGFCPKPVEGQEISGQGVEDAFLGALTNTASHALRGSELELMDVEGRPLMRLAPQSELVGPTWVVSELDIAPGAPKPKLKPPKGDAPLTAVFEDVEIGFVQGQTGVNDFLANYVTPGAAQIQITGAEPFGRACAGRRASTPLCVQEQAYLDLLQSADSFIVRPEDLRLFAGTRPLVRFLPAQVGPVPVEEPAG